MLSSTTQLRRMHLVTATGHAWNYSLRMALKGTCQFVASRGLKLKTFILLSCYFSFGLTSDVGVHCAV
jgi:hypothetical protein